jgi:hypothetical protein
VHIFLAEATRRQNKFSLRNKRTKEENKEKMTKCHKNDFESLSEFDLPDFRPVEHFWKFRCSPIGVSCFGHVAQYLLCFDFGS